MNIPGLSEEVKPTQLSVENRRVILNEILNDLGQANRLVFTVASSRWHVALTKFREVRETNHSLRNLQVAFGQYLAGLVRAKENAITDFIEGVEIRGQKRNVMVSWADSDKALREELLLIQGCLNAAGMIDERQPLDFDFGADVKVPLHHGIQAGAGIHFDNVTKTIEVKGEVKTTELLSNLLKLRLHGRGKFHLYKDELKDDPRLPMMAGIIALEVDSGPVDLTCNRLVETIDRLSHPPVSDSFCLDAEKYLWQAQDYLLGIFSTLKPIVQEFGIARGTYAERDNHLLIDALVKSLFELHNFYGAFSELKLLHNTFTRVNRETGAETWTLLSAAVYLSAQVVAAQETLRNAVDQNPALLNGRQPFTGPKPFSETFPRIPEVPPQFHLRP